MEHLQRIALHVRVVENSLRRDYPTLALIIEIEVTPDGFKIKSVAGDECSTYHQCKTVDFSASAETLRKTVGEVADAMRRAIGG